jgi:CheY-like chemotaxis protein
MGGRLQVSSKLGVGSRFWFDLELEKMSERLETAVAPDSSSLIVGYLGSRRKILVVDDRPENCAVLLNLLTPLGFEVQTAVNGKEALGQALTFAPDLILMDLVMPVMDGFEATRQLRQLPDLKDVRIIALSASAFDETQQESLLAGCSGFLTKPIQADLLLEMIRVHLHLEWVLEETAVSSQPIRDDIPVQGPSATEAAVLHQLALRGDVRGLLQQLDTLDNEVAPFAREVRRLAQTFKLKEIRKLIEPFL